MSNSKRNSNNSNNYSISIISNIDYDIPIIKLVRYNKPEYIDHTLSISQLNYIYYMDKNIPVDILLNQLGLTVSDIMLWSSQSEFFKACIDQYDKNRTYLMEQKLLDNYDNNSDKLKELSIKGKIPQYRDNVLPQLQGVSRIMIDFTDGSAIDPAVGLIPADPIKDVTHDTE